jgi:hypothetical protein
MQRRLTVPLALSVVLLAGCGDGRTIDHKRAEELARKVANMTGQVDVKSVSCPSGEKLKRGAGFDCDLVYTEGTKAKITIHQLDDKGTIRTTATDIHIGEE